MGRRLALIVGNADYQDPKLARLVAPTEDVRSLADVLRNPQIGAFDDVATLLNETGANIRKAVSLFFLRKDRDDLLLFYFSGHGVRDDRGDLYLAVKDTEADVLSGTAIEAGFITNQMDTTHSRRQVLILDCCHSAAFARGSKAAIGESVATGATRLRRRYSPATSLKGSARGMPIRTTMARSRWTSGITTRTARSSAALPGRPRRSSPMTCRVTFSSRKTLGRA